MSSFFVCLFQDKYISHVFRDFDGMMIWCDDLFMLLSYNHYFNNEMNSCDILKIVLHIPTHNVKTLKTLNFEM